MESNEGQERRHSRQPHPLTEAEIEAIAAAIIRQGEPAIRSWFYGNLGRGLWGVLWKALVVAMVGLAAYGVSGGHKPWG